MPVINKDNAKKKKLAALSSVIAGGILTITKLIAGLLTGSIGILSEAAHSLLDLAAAIITYFAVKFGDRPADKTHPYGHGKIENVSALIESGLLFITSAWIIYEAINRLIHNETEIKIAWYAFAIIIFSILIDISRSRALSKVAKETNSQALEADALHFQSDIYSSCAVLIGLIFTQFGIAQADAIAAIVVAFFVILAGYRLGKRTIDVLIDKEPQGINEKVKNILQEIDGIARVNQIRVRPLGANISIEIFIAVNRQYSIQKSEEIIRTIKNKINAEIAEAEIIVHAEPIILDNETIIEKIQSLAAKHNLAIHDIVVDQLDEKKYLSYDLEVLDTLTIKAAHDIASSLEEEIKNELGSDIELNSHIEPLKNEAILSSNVSPLELKKIMEALNKTDLEISEINNIHNILVRKIKEKYFVSFHCFAKASLLLEKAHDAANHFEYLIKKKMPKIKRVVIHVEPK